MNATCLCGAVTVTVPAKPDFIHDCDCSLCRKSGAGWGYYAPEAVTTVGSTISAARPDKPVPAAAVHSCATCGATTHYAMTEAFEQKHGPAAVIGVNMRLFDPEGLAGVEVRFPDGRAWEGEGAFGYRRPPVTIGRDSAW